MQAAGDRWLPREDEEDEASYKRRLRRATLFPAFLDAVEKLTSRPFSKPLSLSGVPTGLEVLEQDADGCGTPLDQLSAQCFRDLAAFGLCHIFVDFPPIKANQGGGRATLAEEAAAGARVLLRRIDPRQLIGWRHDKGRLTQIRVEEWKTVEDGEWATEERRCVRVYEPGGYRLYQRRESESRAGQVTYTTLDGVRPVEGGDFDLVEQGDLVIPRGPAQIPLVTIYANKKGVLQADPPMRGLAYQNLEHWQSSAQQRNILHLARFALLHGKGFDREDFDNNKGMTLGPYKMVLSENPASELSWVEQNGTAIAAGERDLKAIEERMEVLAAAPFVERSSRSTATGKQIDAEQALTKVQSWIRGFEGGLREVFELAARWIDTDLPEDFSVDVYSDFAAPSSVGDQEHILRAARSGLITRRTYLAEIKRRGLLGEAFDVDAEAELLVASPVLSERASETA